MFLIFTVLVLGGIQSKVQSLLPMRNIGWIFLIAIVSLIAYSLVFEMAFFWTPESQYFNHLAINQVKNFLKT